MGAGHVHALYVHEHSRIHSLPPEVKVAATLLFVVSVALTPPRQVWAFGTYALMLATAVVVGGVPWRFFFLRLAGIAPFILFALLICNPFAAMTDQAKMEKMIRMTMMALASKVALSHTNRSSI